MAVRLSFLSACMLLLDDGTGRGININVTVKCSFMIYSPLQWEKPNGMDHYQNL